MKYKVAFLTDFSDEQKLAAFKSLSPSQQKYISNKPAKKAEQSICARMVLAELLGDSPKEKEEILDAARRGSQLALASVDWVGAAPGCIHRLEKLMDDLKQDGSDERLRYLLYYVYGMGLPSIDAFTAALAVFLQKGKDVFGAIRLCAGLGGDTDTVGALTGALCAAYAGGHNIPHEILAQVEQANGLDLAAAARDIEAAFWQ